MPLLRLNRMTIPHGWLLWKMTFAGLVILRRNNAVHI